MRTVKEVSSLTGVSVRTLHHYHAIGLLHPTQITPAGYRLYDEAALERLQLILFFKALQFPLKEIAAILDAPDFDRNRALEQQIELLKLRRQQIDDLLDLAQGTLTIGVKRMDLTKIDPGKLDDYCTQARAMWGKTREYKEFEEKAASRTKEQEDALGTGIMDIFSRFGSIRDRDPRCSEAQALVEALQHFITEHFYTCTPQVLRGLGQMYAAGGSFTENIDRAGGEGTAVFVRQAIEHFCQ